MSKLWRYLRALIRTIQLTLQGEQLKPPDQRYPRLHTWVTQGVQRVEAVFQQADMHGLHEAQRRQIMLNMDKRDTSMEVILQAVKHNLTLEYPMLMDARIEHNITTLYALNMNDQYRVGQLMKEAAITAPAVQQAVQNLSEHLNNIPPSTEIGQI